MAEYSTPEERTEMPTDRRMGQLRKDGALFISHEVVMTISLMAGFSVVSYMAPRVYEDLKTVFRQAFIMIANADELNVSRLHRVFFSLLAMIGPKVFVITLIVAIFSSLAVMLQTNWNIKEQKIKFEWPHINPLAGFKRMFSIGSIVNLGKAFIKLAVILPIGYLSMKFYAPQMIQLIHMDLAEIFVFSGQAMQRIFWKILYVLVAISVFDYAYGKYQWLRQNKMTKDEVKDERKSIEGDEQTKREIRRKGVQRILQRIKQTVPKADVVVTNPTHYAVALQYDRTTMSAPTVVAKGKDFLALRIREIARESGVPVLERKVLARALYSSTEVGTQVPRDLFKAVAEVLAYVYKLKNPWKYQQKGAQ